MGSTPNGVIVVRVATIDDDITWVQMRDKEIDKIVNGLTGFYHEHNPSGSFKDSNKILNSARSDYGCTFCISINEVINPGYGPVKHSYLEPLVIHIQNQILTHHC